ncbi:hypothetical protein BGX26_004248, partial [Mortierella sp. AD094]
MDMAEKDADVAMNDLVDHNLHHDNEDDSGSDNDNGDDDDTLAMIDGANSGNSDSPGLSADNIARLEKRKAQIAANLHNSIRDAVRDALLYDPYIVDTAEAFNIPEDEWITRDNKNRLVFYIKASYFTDWKERHQACIGTSFKSHGKPRAYTTSISKYSSQGKKERAGQIKTRFDCHCRGEKYVAKGIQPGGKTGKTRLRQPSYRCQCTSYFNAVYRPTPTSDGKLENTYCIEYDHQHNHRLGDKDNVGTLQKSKAIRERIKAMVLRGMTIPTIMSQLTIDHARFSRFMEGDDKRRLSRDDFITYDD